MSSGKPIVRQINGFSILIHLLLLGLLCLLFSFHIKPYANALYIALIVYGIILISLRFSIPRNHRKGVSLYKSGNYSSAIIQFQKSYDFFMKYKWVDKYRLITILSSSKSSYTEMSLLNIAFCYGQIGEGELCKEYYEKTLEQFPDSQMAKTSLNMISSFHIKE